MEHFDIIGNVGKHTCVSNKYLHHVYVQVFYKCVCLKSINMHILKINFHMEGDMARSWVWYHIWEKPELYHTA